MRDHPTSTALPINISWDTTGHAAAVELAIAWLDAPADSDDRDTIDWQLARLMDLHGFDTIARGMERGAAQWERKNA